VKASLTGTKVVLRRLAAERSVWVVGVVVGWVVVRLGVCGPVSVDVVVAVDIGARDLLGGGEWEGPPRRLVAAGLEKPLGW
jgi:hypothetical protein